MRMVENMWEQPSGRNTPMFIMKTRTTECREKETRGQQLIEE